jgi:hypothetical protein
MEQEKYDRILYVRNCTYYFERVEGSKISKVNWEQRKIIIDGLNDPTVCAVMYGKKGIFYYYTGGKNRYFSWHKKIM